MTSNTRINQDEENAARDEAAYEEIIGLIPDTFFDKYPFADNNECIRDYITLNQDDYTPKALAQLVVEWFTENIEERILLQKARDVRDNVYQSQFEDDKQFRDLMFCNWLREIHLDTLSDDFESLPTEFMADQNYKFGKLDRNETIKELLVVANQHCEIRCTLGEVAPQI